MNMLTELLSETVLHKNGTMYQGILHSITNGGIILHLLNGTHNVTNSTRDHSDISIQQELAEYSDSVDTQPVWWAAWFLITFALIAGFWGNEDHVSGRKPPVHVAGGFSSTGGNSMFFYTALGDSITAGKSATTPAHAFPSLVVSMLQTGYNRATARILASPGWTSKDLEIAVFETSPAIFQQSNAISIWVGGDDLADAGLAVAQGAPKQTIQRSLAVYGQDLATLVLAIRKASRASIILCTQYNPFPNSPLAVEAIQMLNSLTRGIASRLNTILAPTQAWFDGRQAELIAGYKTGRLEDVLTSPKPPVHPNNKGHLVIAEGLSSIIRGL